MNDKNIIPCEQCHRSVRVPLNRGSIRVQCPHCQAIFVYPPVILTPDMMVTEKKCLNCGYVRHPDDDEFSFAGPTECPMCRAIYEKVEKLEEEREYERRQKRMRLEEELKRREWEREREKTSPERELVEQQAKFREALRQESIQKDKLQQQRGTENIGWFKKKRIEATTRNIIQQIVKQVDFALRENPSLSLQDALIEVNKRGVHFPNEENIITDLSSLFAMMVYKAYNIECFPHDPEALNKDRVEFVMNIAHDYMNMVMSNSGLKPSASEIRETGRDGSFSAQVNRTVLDTQTNLMSATKDKMDQRYPWYAGIGGFIILILLRNCGVI
jgi:uncharacterized Zn finger protein (UPF0148 family)